jgi:Peptidase family M1 domain
MTHAEKWMATLTWLVLLAALGPGPGTARAGGHRAEVRHHLTVTLDPPRHGLKAVDRIDLDLSGLSRIAFDLADHLTVQSVRVGQAPADFTFQGGRLAIALPPGNGRAQLLIAYRGRFDDAVPQAPLNTDNPGYGVTGTIQDQGTMLLAGAGWYLSNPAWPASYDLTVDAPQGVLAVTSGNPRGHTTARGRTRSRWFVPDALQGLCLVAGRYQVDTRTFGRVTAATYFSKPLQHLSNDYLEAVGRYLQLYDTLFGPYAFEQFAVVQNFLPTGYGFASFTLLGGTVLQLPFIIHTSLGHEIAHCWWGNGVLVDPAQGNWCEGLTTYVADYLYQERRGQGQERRLQWLRDYAALVKPGHDLALSRFTARTDPATQTVGYDKGAMVFHMLRQTVGDDCFWQSLRDIYARHRFQAITWTDIRRAFERRSGRSLKDFFQQWVFRAGAPALALSGVAVQSTGRGAGVQGRITQKPPFFDLTLELVLQTTDETIRKPVDLSGEQTAFAILATGRPLQLSVDPDDQVFRRLTPEEVPPTINALKGSGAVRVVIASGQAAGGREAARRLTASLGLDQSRIGPEKGFPAAELAGSDWILVGLPADRTLLTAAGDRFQVSGGQFFLNGRAYARDAASFFGVFQNPFNARRNVALFMPATPSEAQTISAKITHYGRYSYLVFKAARNQLKGTWPEDHSPLTIRWPAAPATGGRRS